MIRRQLEADVISILEKAHDAMADGSSIKQMLEQESVRLALAELQEMAGFRNLDRRLAILCINCFAVGASLALELDTPDKAITPHEEEQARRCLKCDSLKMTNGMLRCKLQKCRYD